MNTKGWSEANIPGLTGMTAVVTGANRGIGLEVARGLAAKGAHVVLAVRSINRGDAAAAAIRATSPGASLEVMALDLADLASVHRFAAAVRSRWDALDLLINNAGVGSASLRRTADGFELVFGTNHLGHFALTGLLLPALTGPPAARVVTVASLAHARGDIDFGNLPWMPSRATRWARRTPRASWPTCCSLRAATPPVRGGSRAAQRGRAPGMGRYRDRSQAARRTPAPAGGSGAHADHAPGAHCGAGCAADPVRGNLTRRAERGLHRAVRAIRRGGSARPGSVE